MNKKITAAEFHDAVERELSGLKPDSGLIQQVIAADREAMKARKILPAGMGVAFAVLIILATAAYAITGLYSVATWQGEISRTVDPTEIPYIQYEKDGETAEQERRLSGFLSSFPCEETVYAWFDNEEHNDIQFGDIKRREKRFETHDAFIRYMSGFRHLTIPAWMPEQKTDYYLAQVHMECEASGKYDLLEEGVQGDIRFNRFLIDESAAVPTEYSIVVTMENGGSYMIDSMLFAGTSDEAILLREEETAERITIDGMDDALLVRNRDTADLLGLIMRRKLDEPVCIKHPHNEYVDEEEIRYTYEQYRIWAFNARDPETLIKMAAGE